MVVALHGVEPEKDVSMVGQRQVGAGEKSAIHYCHTLDQSRGVRHNSKGMAFLMHNG
jgi:hypothetical protein